MFLQQNIIVKNADIIGQRGVKPMTPDEVVKVLEEIIKYPKQVGDSDTPALQSAITLIQDYQKLREKISVEKIEEKLKIAIWYELPYQEREKNMSSANKYLAQSIVTYLQQPTEH